MEFFRGTPSSCYVVFNTDLIILVEASILWIYVYEKLSHEARTRHFARRCYPLVVVLMS